MPEDEEDATAPISVIDDKDMMQMLVKLTLQNSQKVRALPQLRKARALPQSRKANRPMQSRRLRNLIGVTVRLRVALRKHHRANMMFSLTRDRAY